ncbi:MAG: HrpE/YscL family type III secretion apparatus protein [Kiritimatiellae bacterium]|nr:HrpE/YscL family type III secretion apparatus protein [Kiritimatiellia bacterium]
MLLIGNPNFTLVSDRRLVKASEVATVKSAAEIVAVAEAEAARIRDEAKIAFEEERKRGFEKGLQDGKLEIAMQKLEQVDQSVAFMESVEGKMADIVMKALKSCVVEIGDGEMVVNIVRKTMSAVIRTQRHVTLKVAPEMVSVVKERVSALRLDYPTVETFDVVEDPRLKGPACILETEAGVADASVETQLAAIERSLKRHMAGGREGEGAA